MTIRELVNGFITLAGDRSSRISDDSKWSKRLVYYYANLYRTKLLYEKKVSKGRDLSPHNIQTIPCIPLVEVPQVECPCIPSSGCTFRKTAYAIPRPMANAIMSVSSVGGDISYSSVKWDQMKYKASSRTPNQSIMPYFTWKDIGMGTYLYVYNDRHKEYITISGMFEEPLLISSLPKCGEEDISNCISPLDQNFEVDAELIPIITDLLVVKLLGAKQSIAPDTLNNDLDET